jgi:hypothetical protein
MTVKHAILNAFIAVTLLTLPLQMLIDPSIVNIASVCIVLFSSLTLLLYIKWGGAMDEQPLSTFAIFGFCVTTQLGALWVQTLAWTSLIDSLYDPLLTFGTLAFYQAVAVATHVAYRFFTARPSHGMLRGLLGWAGVYRVPSCGTLWIMGVIGMVGFVLSTREGVISRLGAACQFLTWAPFLIPLFVDEVGETYCNAALNKVLLVGYTGAVALLGLGMNVRVIIFLGLITVAFLYLVIGMRSRAPVTKRALIRLGVLAVALLALNVPVSDLATAMAIARGSRGKVPATEMIRRTVAVWRSPAVRDAYKNEQRGSIYAVYDEHYIANPILARLVETKFHDNALHFAGLLKTEQARDQVTAVTEDFLWAILPTPLLDAMGVEVDKTVLTYSMGDYLAYLSRGVKLGGHVTGSMFAQGKVIMGPLFPFLYALICFAVYGLSDLLTVRASDRNASLSAIAMMSLWIYFYRGITSEAVSNLAVFIFRDWEQTLLIYVAVLSAARVVLPRHRAIPNTAAAAGWQRAV